MTFVIETNMSHWCIFCHVFSDGWMVGWVDWGMDRLTFSEVDGRKDGRMDGWTVGWMSELMLSSHLQYV